MKKRRLPKVKELMPKHAAKLTTVEYIKLFTKINWLKPSIFKLNNRKVML